jgi:hypothetical protein
MNLQASGTSLPFKSRIDRSSTLHRVTAGLATSSSEAKKWRRRAFQSLVLLYALVLIAPRGVSQTAVPVNVPTWRYDNTHAGANTQETALTQANVNPAEFGKLFSLAVDGYVYAQPLYISGLTMADGLVHNVLFVATEHDSVYAFDADSNGGANAQPLWKASMLSVAHGTAAGGSTVPSSDLGSRDIVPEVGITSTPVINPAANTLYLVSKTKEAGNYVQRIHALNLITGAEQAGSPSAPITAAVSGTGNGSSGGRLQFSPLWQLNRVALDLWNGHIYVAFGSHGDNGPWHGWLMAFDAQTLIQTGAVCLSPNGYGNGVWGAGAGLPIDALSSNGRMFLVTGNGSFTSYPPVNGNTDYGDSIVRLDLSNGGVVPSDAFTPFNQSSLSSSDADQGSGGVLMLPDQQGSHPHMLIQVGKEGRILVVDRDNMGGYMPGGSSNINILQDISGQVQGLWSTPAYWNGHVYLWGRSDTLKMFDLNSGVLSITPTSNSTIRSNFPSPSPVISSNGSQNGIVWAARSDAYSTGGSEILYAFNANDLTSPIYESDTNAVRDDAGQANKFVVPVVTNGKVYLGAAYQVDVYGLLNGEQQAAPPSANPNGGSFSTAQQVSLSTTTPNATIFYTTDGSLPTPAANAYTGPILIQTDTVLRAVASAEGYLQSPASTFNFTFLTQTLAPLFTPAGGTYTSAQQVVLSDSSPSVSLFYTTDGSAPTTASTHYVGPITIGSTMTVKAIATSLALTPSAVTSATYSIQPSGTAINFGSGFAQVNGLSLNGSAVHSDDSRLQLTTGGKFQVGSAFYQVPMDIRSFATDFSFQLSAAQADGFTFVIQNVGPAALGPVGSGLGYGAGSPGGTGGIPHSIGIKFDLYNNQGEGTNSTGFYTNGASPTIPAIDLTSSGVALRSGDSITAHITYDGAMLTMILTDPVTGSTFAHNFSANIAQLIGSNTAYVGFTGATGGATASQKILTWTFVSQVPPPVQTPVITPYGGSFAAPQTVTMSDLTAGALIHYTSDGSTPTILSPVYSGPISVTTGTTVIEAIAASVQGTLSPLTTATFLVAAPPTPAPAFTPPGGAYAGPQTIALADTVPGSAIYYTTDGSIPTPSSTVYSGPITIVATEVINAIAVASGASPSAVSTAAFTIQPLTQAINYSSGFMTAVGLSLNGAAQVNSSLKALELTDGRTMEAGSAWFSIPTNVSAFTSDFTFQMKNAQADGFTFTLQGSGITAIGPAGGGLGYGPDAPGSAPGIAKSVALKFDIYNNQGEGTNSIGLYTNGASPTIPAIDLSSSQIFLSNGDAFHVHLVYDGSALQVTLTDTTTAASSMTQFPVNIPTLLGTSLGYVGFTGGTGGRTVTTNILSWSFTPIPPGTTAEPTFSPAPGIYTSNLRVILNSLTAGSLIYYTVDGSQPSHFSNIYSAPISVAGNSLTIKAFASRSGTSDSPVVTGTYLIQPAPQTPVFTPNPGMYNAPQTISIISSTPNAVVYYTTDGSTPTPASVQYNGPIVVGATEVVRAIAVLSAGASSNPASGAYEILAGPPINFPAGFANASGLTLNGSAKNGADGNLLLTDTGHFETSSVFFNTPVDIRKFNTSFSFQLTSAIADGFTFTIQSNSATIMGPTGSGLGYGASAPGGIGGIPNSVAIKFDLYNNQGEGTDSIGLYTNGGSPTIPAVDISPSGLSLRSGDPMTATLAYDGSNLTLTIKDQTSGATSSQIFPVNIPGLVKATSAYVGFTAATGGSTAIQKISAWTYTPGT